MEDPGRVSDAMGIFIFPDLSLAVGKESAMVVRWRDTELEPNTLSSYANTSTLIMKQRIAPIVEW